MELRDEEKTKVDKAKNEYEGIIYSFKDWINDDHNKAYITNSQIESFSKKLNTEEDWLIDEGEKGTASEYKKRYD